MTKVVVHNYLSANDTMTLAEAADRINRHSDLRATVSGNHIMVDVYKRPAGYIGLDDLSDLTSSTGWGKHLIRGAAKVYSALTRDSNGFFIGQESGADDAAKKTVKKLQIITKAKSRKPSQ